MIVREEFRIWFGGYGERLGTCGFQTETVVHIAMFDVLQWWSDSNVHFDVVALVAKMKWNSEKMTCVFLCLTESIENTHVFNENPDNKYISYPSFRRSTIIIITHVR